MNTVLERAQYLGISQSRSARSRERSTAYNPVVHCCEIVFKHLRLSDRIYVPLEEKTLYRDLYFAYIISIP